MITAAHARLRVITTTLAVLLLVALVALLGMFDLYKTQNRALTTCYSAADVSFWSLQSIQAQQRGDLAAYQQATVQAESAFAAAQLDDVVDLMHRCEERFYFGTP